MSSKIALLIDAENISYKSLPHILQEVARYGRVILRAVYGDWQRPDLQKWRELAEDNGFKIRHDTKSSRTKNASDMKLIMDAMEVLIYTSADVYCLVTNDADYVPLCEKIRESKKLIVGVGYPNASEALIRSCDQFIFLRHDDMQIALPSQTVVAAGKVSSPHRAAFKALLRKAFDHVTYDTDGWVNLSALGLALRKVQPGFQPNQYGHANLSKLLNSVSDLVEIHVDGPVKSARLKNGAAATGAMRSDRARELVTAVMRQAPLEAGGWVRLSTLGEVVRRVEPGFQSSNFGHATLTKLLQSMPDRVALRVIDKVTFARLRD